MPLSSNVLDEIFLHVQGGYESPQRVLEIFRSERYSPGELDERLLTTAVTEAFAKHERDKLSWPKTTDCDKLDVSFHNLNTSGIVSLQNAGFTQSDGYDDFLAIYERQRNKASILGYCFFNEQDLEAAIKGRGLHLAFGPANANDEQTVGVRVGQLVAEELRRADFVVEWDGTFGKRILIPRFEWKKR